MPWNNKEKKEKTWELLLAGVMGDDRFVTNPLTSEDPSAVFTRLHDIVEEFDTTVPG